MSDRPIAFILASSDHGTMILNRNDSARHGESTFGVGIELLMRRSYAAHEIDLGIALMEMRRRAFGDGLVAVDCGANIGVHTIDWARWMTGWGRVVGIEAQERVYYAFCGNIAINNCMNAHAVHAAATNQDGRMNIPVLDPHKNASFGSLELKPLAQTEDIGQPVNYSPEAMTSVRATKLDSLGLDRLDLLKIDVEGMEVEVIQGAEQLIRAHKPYIMIEFLKTDQAALLALLAGLEYVVYRADNMNVLAVHGGDPNKAEIEQLIARRTAGG